MPFTVRHFQETPNPLAVKCILDKRIRDPGRGPASFRTKDSAAQDPLGSALFGVPGVTTLLINDDWITVNKEPGVEWAAVKAGVSAVLARFEESAA
ncbi:MAG: NifU N-terminal domain-containing protein [Planctomycetota bacterium]|nr:NifU N-terminal domain-containing protein [Planctomycetota bacterium]